MSNETNSFLEIPDDTLVNEIFPYLDNSTLSSVCQTSKHMNMLCQKEELWKRKTSIDYPLVINTKSTNQSWKEYYRNISRGPRVSIYLYGEILAEVVITNETINGDDIKKLIPNKDLDIYYFAELSHERIDNEKYLNQSVPYYHSYDYYPLLQAKCLSPKYELEMIGDQKFNSRIKFVSLLDEGAGLNKNNILNIADSRSKYPYYIYNSYFYDLSDPQNPIVFPTDDVEEYDVEEVMKNRHIL